jgi:membrane protein required for colicin V production
MEVQMNWLDIVLIVALVLSLLIGIWYGLIRMLFTLAGVIIGLLLAGVYADSLADKLTFMDTSGAHMLAFLIILMGTIIVASILGVLVKMLFKNTPLGIADKIGGAILGLLVGAIFIGGILAIYLKYVGPEQIIVTSPTAGFVVDKFGIVLGLLPSQFDTIKSYF